MGRSPSGVSSFGCRRPADLEAFERAALLDVETFGAIDSPWVSQSQCLLAHVRMLRGDLDGALAQARSSVELEQDRGVDRRPLQNRVEAVLVAASPDARLHESSWWLQDLSAVGRHDRGMSVAHIDQRSRRALCFTPMETDRAVIVAASVRAEQLGYEAVIVPEGWGHDSGVLLAEIAMRTERIRLVAGVQSVWGRSDAQLAMEAASLADLSEGRFVLGLGVSTPQLAVGLHDRRFTRPTARLAETLANVRRLLAGERIRLADGTEGLRLNQIPAQPVPIWVAGLGPQTSALARRHADGWFPAFLPAAALRAGFGDGPDEGGDAELVIGPIGAVFDDADVARDVVCQLVGWYLTGMGRMYGDRLAAAGFHREVARLRLANPSPRPGRIVWPPEVDVVLDEVAVHGDAALAAARLERWDSLADIVSVVAPPMIGDAVLDLVEAAAPRIAATTTDRSAR